MNALKVAFVVDSLVNGADYDAEEVVKFLRMRMSAVSPQELRTGLAAARLDPFADRAFLDEVEAILIPSKA